MSERKTSLIIPIGYASLVEDLRLLKSDENNPNRMNQKQKDQVWHSLLKYGWIYPIITNKDGVFTDGEQRVEVCKAHGEFFGPVLRLPVNDVDRRLLRQTLNKLKGEHKRDLDDAEYARIIAAGQEEELRLLLGAVGEKMPQVGDFELAGSSKIFESYEVIVECKDESDQKKLFERFKGEGLKCRVLSL